MIRKFKKGQTVRIRDLVELPKDVKNLSRSETGIRLAGKVGKVLEIGGGYVVLDLEAHLGADGMKGVHLYEIENFIDPNSLKEFKVSLLDGNIFHVLCTDEAMKELAEFIGEDHLDMISKVKKD